MTLGASVEELLEDLDSADSWEMDLSISTVVPNTVSLELEFNKIK